MRSVESSAIPPLGPSKLPVQLRFRAYREKLFILTDTELQVSNLLHWNDRILARVHQGDFLDAIQLALTYYEDRASGNTINLPNSPNERRRIVGNRVKELLRSSLEWAFSDDRMQDDTHYSADGRGVDLTELFEGLAQTCIETSLSLEDTSFLFNDQYEYFVNAGIQNILLRKLEPYIFDGKITDLPPTMVQALVGMHSGEGDFEGAEAIIWHVNPISLDINQAVTLCQAHGLWDALIHVYTRAMGDYAAPVVKLLGLILPHVRNRSRSTHDSSGMNGFLDDDASDAYHLFAYLEAILAGLSYPSGEPLDDAQAITARQSIYDFIFASHLVKWPEGPDGTAVPPLDIDAPYPYLDLILQFDTEALLHSLDIAFEDVYLNDSSSITRQSIVNILLRSMRPERFSTTDITFLDIFIARNIPKYRQFLSLPPSTLHQILVNLASSTDQSTTEDRQLATEFLLSVHNPPDLNEMLALFEEAGFYRIMRTEYLKLGLYGKLVLAHVNDPDMDSELFTSLDELFGSLQKDAPAMRQFEGAISASLSHLLDLSIRQTSILLEKHMPGLHDQAIKALEGSKHKQMAYLRCALEPEAEDDGGFGLLPTISDTTAVDQADRLLYVSLLTRNDSSAVIAFLDRRGRDFFDLPMLAQQFKESSFHDGEIWALDRQDKTDQAFYIVNQVFQARSIDLAQAIVNHAEGDIHIGLQTLQSVCHMALRLCKEHSASKDMAVEDLWYSILHSIMEALHTVSSVTALDTASNLQNGGDALETLGGLVQEVLQTLVVSSSSALSFPRLFKRLVDEAGSSKPSKGRAYSEFKEILTGMLDSYRSEGEMLSMTTRMVEEDLFVGVEEVTRKRQMGWRPSWSQCQVCGKEVLGEESGGLVVVASGFVKHQQCAFSS